MHPFILSLLIMPLLMGEGAYAMSRCLPPEIENFEFVFKGKAVSSTILHEVNRNMKEELLARREEEWSDETIEIWFGKPTITKFKIIDVYKGASRQEVDILHASRSVAGMDFLDGNIYLIYADKMQAEKLKNLQSLDNLEALYAVGRCSVKTLDEVKDDQQKVEQP